MNKKQKLNQKTDTQIALKVIEDLVMQYEVDAQEAKLAGDNHGFLVNDRKVGHLESVLIILEKEEGEIA